MTECICAVINVLNYIPILVDVILNIRVGWVVFGSHYWDICLFLSVDFQKFILGIFACSQHMVFELFKWVLCILYRCTGAEPPVPLHLFLVPQGGVAPVKTSI